LFVESSAARDTLSAFERWWTLPVNVMLLFFGLVNAGVAFANVGTGTWSVLLALLVGKPVGILGAAAVSVQFGLRVPRGVAWRDLIVLGVIAADWLYGGAVSSRPRRSLPGLRSMRPKWVPYSVSLRVSQRSELPSR
jgi:Na+/H+ antiporter 1